MGVAGEKAAFLRLVKAPVTHTVMTNRQGEEKKGGGGGNNVEFVRNTSLDYNNFNGEGMDGTKERKELGEMSEVWGYPFIQAST